MSDALIPLMSGRASASGVSGTDDEDDEAYVEARDRRSDHARMPQQSAMQHYFGASCLLCVVMQCIHHVTQFVGVSTRFSSSALEMFSITEKIRKVRFWHIWQHLIKPLGKPANPFKTPH